MKLEQAAKTRKESRNGKRRYTNRDMAIIKHDESILNSKVKRGELEINPTGKTSVCGCGHEGCFIHPYKEPAK